MVYRKVLYVAMVVILLQMSLQAALPVFAASTNVKMIIVDDPTQPQYTEAAVIDGVSCRKMAIQANGKVAYLFFDVNDDYMGPTDTNATIKVTYYDFGTDQWFIQYSSTDQSVKNPKFKRLEPVVKTDSKQWKTVVLEINDAKFDGSANGFDFRIHGGEYKSEKWLECISQVEVIKG